MKKVTAIYFSATDTTCRCVEKICQGIGAQETQSINLADNIDVKFSELTKDDVVVVASPVYGGRLPKMVAEAFHRLKGNEATAIAVVVYGNREYDDALLELTDILKSVGFRIVGAGAFIGQHSIFPKVATGRPDTADEEELIKFGKACSHAMEADQYNPLTIKGNRPYKKIAGVPVHPKGSQDKCIKCGKCVSHCPVGAINPDKPWDTDDSKCITCGRCILVCSQGARRNSGILYNIIGGVFKAAFSKRKDPFWTLG